MTQPDLKSFFERVYDVLIEHAGASKDGDTRLSFVLYYTDPNRQATEFRFCGTLGMGGKFRANRGKYYVTCYQEDETPRRLKVMDETNQAIKALVVEMGV